MPPSRPAVAATPTDRSSVQGDTDDPGLARGLGSHVVVLADQPRSPSGTYDLEIGGGACPRLVSMSDATGTTDWTCDTLGSVVLMQGPLYPGTAVFWRRDGRVASVCVDADDEDARGGGYLGRGTSRSRAFISSCRDGPGLPTIGIGDYHVVNLPDIGSVGC